MNVLDSIGGILYGLWSWYTIWVIYRLIRFIWPVLKDDWFYFATKSGYYKGFAIGMLWGILLNMPIIEFGYKWAILLISIQFFAAMKIIKNGDASDLQKFVWFGMPFFMCPLWLAIRQGIKEGELPALPNPALNSDAAATS